MANSTARAVAPQISMPASNGPLPLEQAIAQMRDALIDGRLEALLNATDALRASVEQQRRSPASLDPRLRHDLRLCSELMLRANARNQRALRVFFSPVDGYRPDGAANAPTRI